MNNTPRPAAGRSASIPIAWRWLVWCAVLVAAGAGLSHYRVDNDIASWTPGLGVENRADFVVIGFSKDATPRPKAWAERFADEGAIGAWQTIEGDGLMDGLLVWGAGTGGAVLEAVERALGDDAAEVAMAGPPVFNRALDRWSQRGLPLASLLICVIGAAVMYATTRDLRRTAASLFAVFSSQVVLVGVIAWTGSAMNMVLSMTPPLLMGLGFSFAAHRATRPGVDRALRLSMVTTALALAMFTWTDFAPIRSFAIWGSIGMVVTWAAVLCLVDPPSDTSPSEVSASHLTPEPSTRVGLNAAVFAVGLLLIFLATEAMPLLRVQEDALRYFPEDARVVTDYRAIDAELTGTLPFEVVVTPPRADPSSVVLATPGVRRFERMLGDGETSARYFGLASNDGLAALVAAQPAWRAWAKEHGVTLGWRGVAAQLHHIAESVWRTACWALPSMLAVAAVAAWWIDRKWSTALFSVAVNALPVAVLILVLVAMGGNLGLPALLISALAIGVAIDDTLHLLIARRELGSIDAALRRCRRACVGSSAVTALCMLTFFLCPFRPTAQFGVLLAVSVLTALAGDLLMLPAALRLITREAERGESEAAWAVI